MTAHESGNNIENVGEEGGQAKQLLCDNLLCGKGGLNETRKNLPERWVSTVIRIREFQNLCCSAGLLGKVATCTVN